MATDTAKFLDGDLAARDLRFAIVAARFNETIVGELLRGCLDALRRHGALDKQIEVVRVPGAFEIPITGGRVTNVVGSNHFIQRR